MIIAVLVALVGAYRNMLFMGVILCNIAIGIFQEVRSKRIIDRLSVISAPKAHLLRDGEETILPVSDHCPGGHHAAFRGTADMRRWNPRSGGA